MTTSLVWFRRDVRLNDNPAWVEASHDDVVCPLFVIDPHLFQAVSSRRRSLLVAGVKALDRSLTEMGGRLRVEIGDPLEVVPRVANEVGANAVHVNREVTPYGRLRDDAVGRLVTLKQSDGVYVHPPGSLVSGSGSPYRVFSHFYRAWDELPVEPIGNPARPELTADPGTPLPDVEEIGMSAGEGPARVRLAEFAGRVDRYDVERDLPGVDSTSRLSIDLKYGWLGPRDVVASIGGGTSGRRAFVRQIAWRDFYAGLLYAYPETVDLEMRPQYRGIEWREDPDGFAAWQNGNTGYPLVDAGMRQLNTEGWMHNRVRLVAASFLVKDLLIDWRAGERHFRRLLLDADVAQNVGNWQWVAGTGSDAAPYFRVFNPVTQSKRFDPEGTYIRRWVPELGDLPAPLVHEPWKGGSLELAASGVYLGENYPYPILDHSFARQRAIAAYRSAVD